MVHISPDTVERFKKMFKKEYGIEYSDKEAWGATHNLLGFFDLLLKEDRNQHPENYIRKQNSDTEGGVNVHTKSDKIIKE